MRAALRILTRRPAFVVLGVLTLALGIGATAAVFSLRVIGLPLGLGRGLEPGDERSTSPLVVTRWFEVLARLAPGAQLATLRASADVLSQRWAREDASAYAGAGLRVAAFDEEDQQRTRQGAVFLGLVALVLLIACANAANLALADCEARRRELAVRVALGASRSRLLRQLVAEGLMLSAVGTAAGLLLAKALLGALPALVPPTSVPYVLDARFDHRLLAFATLLLTATTALVAAVPAWRHSRPDVVTDLKQATVAGVDGRFNARDLIVVAQMALGVVVLVAAGLLVRSLAHSSRIDPGFDPEKRVATLYLVPALRGYDDDACLRFFERARCAPATRSVSPRRGTRPAGRPSSRSRGRRLRRARTRSTSATASSARTTSRRSGRGSCTAAGSARATGPTATPSRSSTGPWRRGSGPARTRSADGS